MSIESIPTLPRTFCAEIPKCASGSRLRVCGWVREVENSTFVLTDSTGTIRVNPDQVPDWDAHSLRANDVVEVFGTAENGIIIRADTLIVHNRAVASEPGVPLPLSRSGYLRFRRHEYVELLRQANRAQIEARSFLQERGFIEISTPLLWRSVQEYAEPEFVVTHPNMPGRCYHLLQSPMPPSLLAAIGGLDRTFQFARCFRWEGMTEDSRKATEFTHLNMTLTFTTLEEGKSLLEDLVSHLIRKTVGVDVPTPFPRLNYDEAMRLYSCDTPDYRYRDYLRLTLQAEQVGRRVGEHLMLVIPHELPRGVAVLLGSMLKEHFGPEFGILLVRQDEVVPLYAGLCYVGDVRTLLAECGRRPPVSLVLVPGPRQKALLLFDTISRTIRKMLDPTPLPRFAFVWIDSIPFLTDRSVEPSGSGGSFHQSRSVFGRTVPPVSSGEPLRVVQHDLILNGLEVGTGGEKEHRLSEYVKNLEIAKVDRPRVRYGYHMDALTYGAPPMLNTVLGWERFLWYVLGTDSLYDLFLLPKDATGRCAVSDLPEDLGARAEVEHGPY